MKTTYKIDPTHCTAQFVARHMMVTNVRGGFSGVQATVVYDPENPAASSAAETRRVVQSINARLRGVS